MGGHDPALPAALVHPREHRHVSGPAQVQVQEARAGCSCHAECPPRQRQRWPPARQPPAPPTAGLVRRRAGWRTCRTGMLRPGRQTDDQKSSSKGHACVHPRLRSGADMGGARSSAAAPPLGRWCLHRLAPRSGSGLQLTEIAAAMPATAPRGVAGYDRSTLHVSAAVLVVGAASGAGRAAARARCMLAGRASGLPHTTPHACACANAGLQQARLRRVQRRLTCAVDGLEQAPPARARARHPRRVWSWKCAAAQLSPGRHQAPCP